LIPHRDDVKLDDVDAFKNHLAIWERQGGCTTLRIQNVTTGEIHSMEVPETVYVIDSGANAEFDTNILRFTYSSFTTPTTLFDYNMDTREKKFLKQEEVLGGFDATLYESKCEYAVSHDGAKVPVSIVYKKDLFKKDGSNPLFLVRISMSVCFQKKKFSILLPMNLMVV
jgi:oligopeptidase B